MHWSLVKEASSKPWMPMRTIDYADHSTRIQRQHSSTTQGPIERQMRKDISDLSSSYSDDFDWSIYDKFANRFFIDQPTETVFNTNFKLANYNFNSCKSHYAIEIDTYKRECFHNSVDRCENDHRGSRDFWNRPQIFPVNLVEIRKVLHTVFETDHPCEWREIMEKRIALRLGSTNDCFAWIDLKYGVTKELLRMLNFYDYPHIIITESDLVAHDDYLKLLKKDLCSVQFKISGNNNRFLRIIEPGAPSYDRRLKALSKLNAAGFRTSVWVNPLFPRYPDGFFTDSMSIAARFGSRQNCPTLPIYDDQFIGEIANTGVSTLFAEFIRFTPQAVSNLAQISGIDLMSFFKPNLQREGASKTYSDSEIFHYYKKFAEDCRNHEIRFCSRNIDNGFRDYFPGKGNLQPQGKQLKICAHQPRPWFRREKRASDTWTQHERKSIENETDNQSSSKVVCLKPNSLNPSGPSTHEI